MRRRSSNRVLSGKIDIILHVLLGVISFIRAFEGFDKFIWKLKSEGENGNGFNQEKEQNIINNENDNR